MMKMLTTRNVRMAVRKVAASTGDYEVAGGLESELHERVLLAISQGRCEDPRACAAEALKTLAIKFSRHRA